MKAIPVTLCDSVLFDLDGTLWDASVACAKAWTQAMNDVGYAEFVVTSDEVRRFTGLQVETILADYFPHVTLARRPVLLDRYWKRENEVMGKLGGQLYPRTEEVLTELRQTHALFIISNCLEGYVENFFRLTGLEELFDGWESFGRSGRPKTENIAAIIERHDLQFPVYVGDTYHDAKAAEASKVPFVFAEYGFGEVAAPRHSIRAIEDLLHLL